jgi:hypothetical protein
MIHIQFISTNANRSSANTGLVTPDDVVDEEEQADIDRLDNSNILITRLAHLVCIEECCVGRGKQCTWKPIKFI